ncbi:MAG: glutamate--tRNA ligase family protein, partial [Arcobacteraceae bacterium]
MLRFAPSQTEDIKIDSLRVALFHHILSKTQNEELIIRIADTQKEKNIENKDKEILELLSLFSIDYTRVVYQSENIKYHTQMAMKLLLDKKAFNCFCSDEALAQDKEIAKKENKPYAYSGFCETISDETKFNCNAPFIVRMKQPKVAVTITDILQGKLSYTPVQIDSFKILNHDKSPTASFATAVDDMLFDISTIVSLEKNSLETAQQKHIRTALGYEKEINTLFLPDIIDAKMSVQSLVEKGYLPAAIANYLISLCYETSQEIFTLEDIIKDFDLSKIIQTPAKFEKEKLNQINRKYMLMLEDMRFSKIIGFADEDIGKLAKLYVEECNTTKEIEEKIKAIFSEKKSLENFEEEFVTLKKCLQKAPFIKEFDDLIKYITKNTNLE